MRQPTATLLAAGILLAATPATPQESDVTSGMAAKLVSCTRIEGATERLACFDGTVAPLVRLAESRKEGETLVDSFVGADDWDSPVLEMTQPWHVNWESETNILTVELRDARGEHLNVIGHQIGSGSGRSETVEPGSYRIALRSIGDWRIDVVEEEKR